MDRIIFNKLQLIENSLDSVERFVVPTKSIFKHIEPQFHLLIDGTYYEINTEVTDNYVWFAFDYGKPNPIDEELTNINTGRKKDNPRNIDEAELLHQLFACYDFNEELLYLSSLHKISLFEFMLTEQLNIAVNVKKILKSADEFIEIFKQIDEISFTEIKDLFNQDSKKRQALIDLTGTDAPDKFALTAKYSKNRSIVSFIKELMLSKQSHHLKELVIKGVDNDNFEFVFNVDSFIQKITIPIDKDENGKFDPIDVKSMLISRLSYERN